MSWETGTIRMLGDSWLLLAALGGASLIVALALGVTGWRQMAGARAARKAARFARDLLEAGPARPLLITGDGRLELDERLARELGLAPVLPSIDQLADGENGLEPDDVARLAGLVSA